MIQYCKTVMARTLGTALLLLFLALPAQAQGVIIVDAAGGGDFTEIQPAVDAAAPGTLIRIRHGRYAEEVTIRKGIRLIGDRWHRGGATAVFVEGSIRVLDLPANQSFVCADILLLLSGAEPRSFNFEDCRGNVHITHSIGRLRIRRCNYVTADLMLGEGSSAEHGVLVEDSFLIATNSVWNSSLLGAPVPMEAIRSKVILVKVELFNYNALGAAVPMTSAIVLTDSELIYTGDVKFIVFCDPALRQCPPLIKLLGSSTVMKEDRGASAVVADIHEPELLQIRYGAGNSSVFALVAGFPIKPIELLEGTLVVDIATSFLLHVCPPPPPFAFVRINFALPPGNRFGIPITFQAAALMRIGGIKLSIPLTVVL